MRIGRQRAGEQSIDPRPAELPGGQADAVDHQQLRLHARGARIEMR
jgi:hypothetical protein